MTEQTQTPTHWPNHPREATRNQRTRNAFLPIPDRPGFWYVVGRDMQVSRQDGKVFLFHPGGTNPRTITAILNRFERFINLTEANHG